MQREIRAEYAMQQQCESSFWVHYTGSPVSQAVTCRANDAKAAKMSWEAAIVMLLPLLLLLASPKYTARADAASAAACSSISNRG